MRVNLKCEEIELQRSNVLLTSHSRAELSGGLKQGLLARTGQHSLVGVLENSGIPA